MKKLNVEESEPKASGSVETDASGEPQGACGGSDKPISRREWLDKQEQMFAVQPKPWCPHLETVQPLPDRPLDTADPCETCGDRSENWVCLVCYKVFCSRFVNEHMLFHGIDAGHLMTLSYSDLSVWCYGCDDYIDHQTVYPMKRAAHRSKFGEDLPHLQ